MNIRPYHEGDEEGVVELWRTAFPDDTARHEPRSAIRRKLAVQPDLFLVGVLNGRIIATALAGFDGYRGWVYRVAVAQDQRRHGHGRAIMRKIEQELRRLGCPKLNLQVRGSNAAAAEFYRRLGYAVEDRISLGKPL